METTNGGGKSILFAEDDATTRMLVSTMLSKLGFCAELAKDGGEALAKLQQGIYDAVILDLRMPVMDGLEVAKRLRRLEKDEPERKRMTVIVLSGDETDALRRECHAAGIDAFLPKPCRVTDLAELLGGR